MKSKFRFSTISKKWFGLAGLLALAVIAVGTQHTWRPPLLSWIERVTGATRPQPSEIAKHGDSPEHSHSARASLELSPQARSNLGLTDEFIRPIALTTFRRSIDVPAVVVLRPGRTQIQVSTPLTGVITHVHAVTGEAVVPGTLLFEIRLTHEDLVTAQTDFLKTLGELEVENREIVRLEEVTQSGAISGKTLLERQYSRQKLEALLKAQREALKLHGLSDRQVEKIADDRQLLRDLQIVAPTIDEHAHENELRLSSLPAKPISYERVESQAPTDQQVLIIERLDVHKGQSVAAGELLCTLADFSRLYIEAQAFEKDSDAIGRAAANSWPVTAVFSNENSEQSLAGLKLAYVGNAINRDTRALSFFVDLPNEILRDETNADQQRFVSWKYRPGQRLVVRVPVEEWVDQIVLPLEAAEKEGAEWFVFVQNGDQFERVQVHVKYRDQANVVIANDGSLFPGDMVAFRAAHQMQIAIKNKSGGGADPHAGHNH